MPNSQGFEYNQTCSMIPELIGTCMAHKAPDYGHGIITKAYVHPRDPKTVFVVISFDNKVKRSYFNFFKMLGSKILTFDNDKEFDENALEKLRSEAAEELYSKTLREARERIAGFAVEKKVNAYYRKLAEEELERKRFEDEVKKMLLLKEQQERERAARAEQERIRRKRAEAAEIRAREIELEEQERREQEEKARNIQAQLNLIPSSYMYLELSYKEVYIIVCRAREEDREKNILFYKDPFARDLLGAASKIELCGQGTVGDRRYWITYKQINQFNQYSEVSVPAESILIKKNGGMKYKGMTSDEEIISLLLYSPFTKHYEFTRGTYDKQKDQVYIDCKVFREFLYEYGKPDIDIDFESSSGGGGGFLNLNEESVLRGYGYTVSQQEGLSHELRMKLLKELIDLEILSMKQIVDHLDFCISTHRGPEYSIARGKWTEDRKEIIDYIEDPKRFLVR